MAELSRNVLLKLLSGLQTGAELLLSAGEYTLGSDESCDLVLMDAAVRSRHALLSVSGESGVSITSVGDAPITLGGRPVSGVIPLHDFDVIGLGGVYVAVGPDAPWPQLPAIPPPYREEEKPDASEPEHDNAVADEADGISGEQATRTESSREQPSAESEDSPTPSPSAVRRKRRLLAAVLILALAAGLLGGGIYAFTSLFARSPGDMLAGTLRDQGVSALYPAPADPNLLAPGQIGLSDDGREGFILKGLVKDVEEKFSIRNNPALSDVSITDELTLADTETRRVNRELQAAFPWAELTPSENGFYAILSGLAPKTDDINKAYRLARTALDNRIAIRRSVMDWSDLRRGSESHAIKLGVSNPRFTLKNGEIFFSSSPWPTLFQREDLITYIDNEFGGAVASQFEKALAKAPQPAPRRSPLSADYIAALSPLPQINPPAGSESAPASAPAPEPAIIAQPIPQPEPASESAMPEPQPQAPDHQPEPEPAPEPFPAPEPKAAPKPYVPPVKRWRVDFITPDGFIDHHGKRHKAGDYLSSNLRLVSSWDDGVVFQRGSETLFGEVGTIIADLTVSKALPK